MMPKDRGRTGRTGRDVTSARGTGLRLRAGRDRLPAPPSVTPPARSTSQARTAPVAFREPRLPAECEQVRQPAVVIGEQQRPGVVRRRRGPWAGVRGIVFGRRVGVRRRWWRLLGEALPHCGGGRTAR